MRGRRVNYRNRQSLVGFSLTLPAAAFFVCFSVFPTLFAFVISFFQYDLFHPPTFVGVENYVGLLHDKNFLEAFRVTVTFMLLFGPLSWVLGFLAASVLKDRIFGRGAARTILFVPTILSAVAMATAWSLLLRPNGPINAIIGVRIPWLTSQSTALAGIALMSIWQSAGWFMVVFLAGLLSVPNEFYEAARIDGAGRWASLRYITLPMLRPVFALVVVWTLVAGMKVFTPMFIMTGGGPNNATRSIAMLIYQLGLQDLRFGEASAISIVGFVIILMLTIVYLRVFRVHKAIGE